MTCSIVAVNGITSWFQLFHFITIVTSSNTFLENVFLSLIHITITKWGYNNTIFNNFRNIHNVIFESRATAMKKFFFSQVFQLSMSECSFHRVCTKKYILGEILVLERCLSWVILSIAKNCAAVDGNLTVFFKLIGICRWDVSTSNEIHW